MHKMKLLLTYSKSATASINTQKHSQWKHTEMGEKIKQAHQLYFSMGQINYKETFFLFLQKKNVYL